VISTSVRRRKDPLEVSHRGDVAEAAVEYNDAHVSSRMA
jgi:hypothetical protein